MTGRSSSAIPCSAWIASLGSDQRGFQFHLGQGHLSGALRVQFGFQFPPRGAFLFQRGFQAGDVFHAVGVEAIPALVCCDIEGAHRFRDGVERVCFGGQRHDELQ